MTLSLLFLSFILSIYMEVGGYMKLTEGIIFHHFAFFLSHLV